MGTQCNARSSALQLNTLILSLLPLCQTMPRSGSCCVCCTTPTSEPRVAIRCTRGCSRHGCVLCRAWFCGQCSFLDLTSLLSCVRCARSGWPSTVCCSSSLRDRTRSLSRRRSGTKLAMSCNLAPAARADRFPIPHNFLCRELLNMRRAWAIVDFDHSCVEDVRIAPSSSSGLCLVAYHPMLACF